MVAAAFHLLSGFSVMSRMIMLSMYWLAFPRFFPLCLFQEHSQIFLHFLDLVAFAEWKAELLEDSHASGASVTASVHRIREEEAGRKKGEGPQKIRKSRSPWGLNGGDSARILPEHLGTGGLLRKKRLHGVPGEAGCWAPGLQGMVSVSATPRPGLLDLPTPEWQRTRPAGPTLSTLHCVRSQDLFMIPEGELIIPLHRAG